MTAVSADDLKQQSQASRDQSEDLRVEVGTLVLLGEGRIAMLLQAGIASSL